MNKKQLFEGIHVLEVPFSLIPIIFILTNIKDKLIAIVEWFTLLPFIFLPILVIFVTWIILRFRPMWGSSLYIVTRLIRFTSLCFSFTFIEATFVFLAGNIILWAYILYNTRELRLNFSIWKTQVESWVFLMAGILAGFAISCLLRTILEIIPGLWFSFIIELLMIICLIEETRSGLFPDFFRVNQKRLNSPSVFSLLLIIFECLIPLVLLILGFLLPNLVSWPLDTGFTYLLLATVAAILALTFAIIYRVIFCQVPIVT